MQFINEQDDLARRTLDLLEERLEPIFELATILGAGDQCAQVERHDPLIFQGLRNVPLRDALGESLRDRRLAHAGFADQDRVVLRAPRQHLDDAANLFLTADDRVQLPLPGEGREIPSVFLDGLKLRLGRCIGHTGRSPDLGKRLQDLFSRGAGSTEDPGRLRVGLVGDGEEEMLGGQVLILEPLHLGPGHIQDLLQSRAEIGLGAVHLGEAVERCLQVSGDAGRVCAQSQQERRHGPVLLFQEREQQVFGEDFLVLRLLGKRLCLLDRLLGLLGQTVGTDRHGEGVPGNECCLNLRQHDTVCLGWDGRR